MERAIDIVKKISNEVVTDRGGKECSSHCPYIDISPSYYCRLFNETLKCEEDNSNPEWIEEFVYRSRHCIELEEVIKTFSETKKKVKTKKEKIS